MPHLRRATRWIAASILLCRVPLLSPADSAPGDPRLARLERQVQAFTKTIPARVGVAIKHLESGREVLINGDERFPMASTFKVPLLVEVLAQEKAGKLRLSDEMVLEKRHQHLGTGSLKYESPGVKLSVRTLCERMMVVSDNSAADWLLERVGRQNVNARLKAAGISGIRIDRSAQEVILDYLGFDSKKHADKPPDELQRLGVSSEPLTPASAEARRRYYADPRDTATPAAMNQLLEKVVRADVLDRERSDLMLNWMKQCQTGEKRLRGLLPPGAVVAHKTGSVGTAIHDAGILYLPDGAGHVILSVFTKDPEADDGQFDREKHERLIAQIARSSYDYFVFTAR